MSSPKVDLKNIKVAILGGGSVGATLLKSIHVSGMVGDVKVAARDPDKTKAQLTEKGFGDDVVACVGGVSEVLSNCDVIILAVPGSHEEEGIKKLAESISEFIVENKTVIIDATNPLSPFPDGLNVRWEQGTSGGELLAKYIPTAKVYKSLNTIFVQQMTREKASGKQMLIAGDGDEVSRAIAEGVVSAVGFDPVYFGPIRYARNLEAMAEMWIHMAVLPLGGQKANPETAWIGINL